MSGRNYNVTNLVAGVNCSTGKRIRAQSAGLVTTPKPLNRHPLQYRFSNSPFPADNSMLNAMEILVELAAS